MTRAPHLLFPQSQRATWGRSSGLALMRPWPAGELTGSADRFGVAWPGVAALPQEASAPQQAGPRECWTDFHEQRQDVSGPSLLRPRLGPMTPSLSPGSVGQIKLRGQPGGRSGGKKHRTRKGRMEAVLTHHPLYHKVRKLEVSLTWPTYMPFCHR